MGAKSWEEGTSGVQQLPHGARRHEGRACPDNHSTTGREGALSQHPAQVTMPGASVAGWARGALLHYPGPGDRLCCVRVQKSGSSFQPALVLECACPWWLGPKPCLMGVSCCPPFLLQQSGRRPHPSQALPPEYEQIPRFAELRLSLRDVHCAETGASDLPVHRQGEGRCCPQEQDQPSRLRPPAPALPARGRPGPDSVVPRATGTPGSRLPLESSARHPL